MKLLLLGLCIITILVMDHYADKDHMRQNERQGLAYGLSLFLFRDKNTFLYDKTTNLYLKGGYYYEYV